VIPDKNNGDVKLFREIDKGQWFDFISPVPSMNSFTKRCRKISQLRYVDEDDQVHRIGSPICVVYHVSNDRVMSQASVETKQHTDSAKANVAAAMALMRQKQAEGWTKEDFAEALKQMMESDTGD
jgi:predicted DNA-binding WGR domain protein